MIGTLARLAATLISTVLLGSSLLAQTLVPPQMDPLEEFNIPNTTSGLVAALRHPDYAVRQAAAFKLGFSPPRPITLPAMLGALATEENPYARSALATAASALGSEQGLASLRGMCVDATASALSRSLAAHAMSFFLKRDDCTGTLLDALRLRENSGAMFYALDALNRSVNHLSAQEEDELRGLAAILVRSDNFQVRTL